MSFNLYTRMKAVINLFTEHQKIDDMLTACSNVTLSVQRRKMTHERWNWKSLGDMQLPPIETGSYHDTMQEHNRTMDENIVCWPHTKVPRIFL